MKEKFLKDFINSRIKEIVGVILILSSLYLILALITYHPLDPSIYKTFDSQIYNKAGKYGALTSSYMLEKFGIISYLFTIFIFIWGIFFVQKQTPKYVALRICAFILCITSLTYLISYITISNNWQFISYGGILGYYLKTIIEQYSITYISIITAMLVASFSICYCRIISYRKLFKLLNITTRLIASKSISYSQKLILSIRNITTLVKLFCLKKFIRRKNTILDFENSQLENREKHTNHIKDKATKVINNRIAPYKLPSINLLSQHNNRRDISPTKDKLKVSAQILQNTLDDFGVKGRIISAKPGPVITLYELEPSPGIKSSRIIALADDIARSMKAKSARISVIPGKNALGIELPNENRETVFLRNIFATDAFKNDLSLPLALGKTISGESMAVDLAKMPHLLVAGTTGSGKSVAINTMILSLLYKLKPDQCKFIMIDPKMLELSIYDGIPHLLTPVVTDPKKAVNALKWVVQEMEDRYRLMSAVSVRNIDGYNKTIIDAKNENKQLHRTIQTGFDADTGSPIYEEVELEMVTIPYIVVIVDEMADLMLVAGKEIEGYIQRIAQMARAAGIHLIIATQRPSVDVITGVIKANFPTRISFQVTSKIDSRTILGEQGAEQLLGMGDMLYMHGGTKVVRVHGPYVSDREVNDIVTNLKKQGKPTYLDDITDEQEENNEQFSSSSSSQDSLYDRALQIVIRDKKVSISYIQRQLKIGYNRAANIIEEMENNGAISAPQTNGKREILIGNND